MEEPYEDNPMGEVQRDYAEREVRCDFVIGRQNHERETMKKIKIALSFIALTCFSLRADYTISQDEVHLGQVEGSHNNGGHEHVVWNITVPVGTVAHVSVFGTMSSVACSWKSAYLIFTGDSEEHHFGGYADGITYSATFEKSSKVTIYANAKPGEYSELVPVVNPITGSVTYTHRYVTYSAYTCTLKYEITVTYKSLAKHTVKYLPGTNGSGAERSQQKTVGVDLDLLGAVFSRSGYSQVGWSLRSDGSTLDYSLCETYAKDDDLTLYPYWQQGSAAAVPVSLVVNGGTSISPGSSMNLTCRVKYSDGSSRLVTPKWLISAGVNNATISSVGVLSVKASATGNVTVKAIFVESEVFVVNTMEITIKSDASRIVTVVPWGGGYVKSEDFDAGDTFAWYFDVSECPNWVTDPIVAIASGSYKGSTYDLTTYWTTPIEEARNKQCNLVDTAHFSIRASENNTTQERFWTVPAKDYLGNVLKTFMFVQKSYNAESSFGLSVTGESQVKAGHQSLYVCEAVFSNGSATLVQPTWSVSAGNTTASVSSDGVLTVGKMTEKTSVTLSARLSCNGKTETATKTVTILPQESVQAAPSDVIASDGTSSDGVLVSWTKATNATYYDLYRSSTSTRPSSPTWTGVTSPYSDTTAEPGATYYYWVAAVNSVGSAVSSYDTGYRAAHVATTYAVTYEPGAYASGSTLTATKTEGVSLTLKGATFTRTGYTQTGWSTDYYGSTKSYSLSGSYMSDAAVTLYPYWTANTYTITYALNGGTYGSTHPTSATYDTSFFVSAPTLSGYTFAGWTVTSGLDTSTAKWGASSSPAAAISNTSTKCVNGATGSVYFKSLTAASGETVTLTANWQAMPSALPDLSFGYKNKGWPQSLFLSDSPANSNAVVRFAQGSPIYLFCRFDNDGEADVPAGFDVLHEVLDANGNCEATYLSEINFSVSAGRGRYWEGSRFEILQGLEPGEYTYRCTLDSRKKVNESNEDNNVRTYGFTVVSSLTSYEVSYQSGTYASGAAVTATKTKGTALALMGATFARTGYTQTGWSKNANGGTKDYNLNASYTTDAAVTLYPYWTANTYTITYALNGGTYGSTHPTSATYDTSFFVSAPTRSGYTFAGWTVTIGLDTSTAKWGTSSSPAAAISNTSTKCVNGATGSVWFENLTAAPNGSMTLAANWDLVPTYSVTYAPGAHVIGASQSATKTQGLAYTLRGEMFARTGYTQTGWSKNVDGSTKDYELGAAYTTDAAVTLYPYWEANEYMVRFDANGGTGTMADQAFRYDEEQKLRLNAFLRTGYTFSGWCVSAPGSEVHPVADPSGAFGRGYAGMVGDGETVSNLTAVAGVVVTLCAQWEEIIELTPVEPMVTNTITYVGLESAANTNVTQFTTNDLPLVLGPVDREGYRFLGWAPNGGVIPVGTVTNVTFTANWEVLKSTVDIDGVVGTDFAYGQEVTAATFAEKTEGHMNLVCIGWTGTGDVPTMGVGTQVTFTVTQASSLRWCYETNYWVSVTANEGGTVVLKDAAGMTLATNEVWAAAGTNLTAVATADEGFVFARWIDVETGATCGADGVHPLPVNRQWTIRAEFTNLMYVVRFDVNGGTGEMTDQTFEYGRAQALARNRFERTGYAFAGWADDADAAVASYADGEVVSNLTAEAGGIVVLFAQWEGDECEEIVFELPDGTKLEGRVGEVVTLPGDLPKTGYRLVGWRVGGKVYRPGDWFVIPTASVLLEPVYELNTIHADESAVIHEGEVAPYETAAATYDGYLYDGESIVGSVQVKVAKGKVDKKTGVFTAKVTASVLLEGETKKLSFKDGLADERGNITDMSDKTGNRLAVSVGVNGLGGTFRRAGSDTPYRIDGARNFFSGKSDADKKATEDAVRLYLGTYNVSLEKGTLTVVVDKKGKAKVAGTVDGNAVSASSQLLVGDGVATIPVVVANKKVSLAFCLWLTENGTVEVLGTAGIAGKPERIESGATFNLDADAFAELLDGLYADFLPNGLSVDDDGKKWIVAKGAKTGKLVLFDKTTGALDGSKSKVTDNMSGLKLTYKTKDGTFTGSFKVYTFEMSKIKSYTANVKGVMIGEKGYGFATISKVGSVAVEISTFRLTGN